MEMAVSTPMDTLTETASFLREAQKKCESIKAGFASTLGSSDRRISSLGEALRPIQECVNTYRRVDGNIDRAMDAAAKILDQFHLMRKVDAKLQKGPSEDLESYAEAIDQLKSILYFFLSDRSFRINAGAVDGVSQLIAKSIKYLEDIFESQLLSNSKPLASDHLAKHQVKSLEISVCSPQTLKTPGIIPLLHKIAFLLVNSARGHQCFNIYRNIRAPALEERLRKLGAEMISEEDVQKMEWKALETKIVDWIHIIRTAVRLFAEERKVCDQIFKAMDPFRDRCFVEVTAKRVSLLLSFGEAIAKSKRSPEKLFVLLDMYETMQEVHSETEMIFEGNACFQTRDSISNLTKRLAHTAYTTLCDFEERVEKDLSKPIGPDGAVHPLTSYVVNYMKFLFDYQSTMERIFQEFEPGGGTDSCLATVMKRILQALQSNLDAMSEQYKDPALSHIFLMNNTHHMVKSVRKSEIKSLLGDDWVQRHRRIVQQHSKEYKKISWLEIARCFSFGDMITSGRIQRRSDGLLDTTGLSKSIAKERFKSFRMQFEELHRRQSRWEVADAELCDNLRLSIAEIIINAYRSYIKLCGHLFEKSKDRQKYFAYTEDDITRMIGEFFKERSERGNGSAKNVGSVSK